MLPMPRSMIKKNNQELQVYLKQNLLVDDFLRNFEK